MASIKTNHSFSCHSYGPYSIERAEKIFQEDLNHAKNNRDIKSCKVKILEGKKVFEAEFFDGWDHWTLTETLDYNDNNTYSRCC